MYFYRPISNCLQQCSSNRSGEDSLAACGRGEPKDSLAAGRLQDRATPGRRQKHKAQEQVNQEAMETDRGGGWGRREPGAPSQQTQEPYSYPIQAMTIPPGLPPGKSGTIRIPRVTHSVPSLAASPYELYPDPPQPPTKKGSQIRNPQRSKGTNSAGLSPPFFTCFAWFILRICIKFLSQDGCISSPSGFYGRQPRHFCVTAELSYRS